MKVPFHVECSLGASFLTPQDRKAIVQEVVTEAEKLKPGEQDVVIYDIGASDLRVVVRIAARKVHIMTSKEAAEIGLPGPRRQSPTDN